MAQHFLEKSEHHLWGLRAWEEEELECPLFHWPGVFGVRKGGVLSRGCVFWPPTCQAGVSSQLLYFENRVHTFNSLQISIWESQPEAFELGQAGSYACVSFLCHMANELNQHMENSLNTSHSRPGWRFGLVECTGFWVWDPQPCKFFAALSFQIRCWGHEQSVCGRGSHSQGWKGNRGGSLFHPTMRGEVTAVRKDSGH